MKASDAIAIKLKSLGIETAFVVAGGMITHLIDSFDKNGINIITNYHEQGSAFCVFGAAKATDKPFIALATSGPGATNLLTGIGSCYFDSVPSIFITGQVNTHEKKGNKGVRQLGFQETEICSMARPITKACFEITEQSDILDVLSESYRICTSGRPGPVLIDIPMNLQSLSIDFKSMKEESTFKNLDKTDELLNDLLNSIKNSKRPIILSGRGVTCSKSQKELIEFVELTKIPVVKSLLGLDTYTQLNDFNIGFIGSYGNRWANIALGDSDLIIVLGSRLDIRQTGARLDIFENKSIFHIDIDLNEINNRVKGCVAINQDIKSFLIRFNSCFQNTVFNPKKEWIEEIKLNRSKWPAASEQNVKQDEINPNEFITMLSNAKGANMIKYYTADVGSHQMWAAQSLSLKENQRFITCGGMGAMGSALPAAIGACIGLEKARGVVFVGDGSMQMNIQELQTIAHHKLPITIIIFNNKSLGMIRQFQDSYFEARYQSTVLGYSTPSFKDIGTAYGIESIHLEKNKEVKSIIDKIISHSKNNSNPLLVVVDIPLQYNALPKIAFGRTIKEMEPQFKPNKMEST